MSRAFRRALVLSLVLKAVLAVLFADITPQYDEIEFLQFGANIAENGASPALWRAPGYQWFVAAGLLVGGGGTVLIRLLQVLLSVASSIIVYRIGKNLWNETAATAAGIFLAFYPSHVAFSHLLWSETLYGFLLLLAMERLLAADREQTMPAALTAGLVMAAAALTRSTAVLLMLMSFLWLLTRHGSKSRLKLAAVFLGGGMLLVLPWSIWASSLAGRPVLIDTNAGFNLWSGNNRYIPGDLQGVWAVGHLQHNGLNPALTEFLPDDLWRAEAPQRMKKDGVADPHDPEGETWYRTRALEVIRGDPAGFLARIPAKLSAFWAPDFFLPRHLVRDWYGETPAGMALFLVLLTWAAGAVPLLAGPAALAVSGRTRFRSLALLWIGTYMAVIAVAYGHSRMHQPLVPILVLAVAGVAFTHGAFPSGRRLWTRAAPVAVMILAAWIYVFPVMGGVYIAPGPRHALTARVLGSARHLPLPGSRRLAWMLASVEASLGREAAAVGILSEPQFADEPWSLYLRARITRSGTERERLLTEAVQADPDLFAGWYILALTRIQAGDHNGARAALYRAGRLRPWDPRVERAYAMMR